MAWQRHWVVACAALSGMALAVAAASAAPPGPLRPELRGTLVQPVQSPAPSAAEEAERLRRAAEEAQKQRQQAVAEEARRQQQLADQAKQQAIESAQRKQAAAEAARRKQTAKQTQPPVTGTPKAQQPAAGSPKVAQPAAVGAAKAQQPAAGTPKAAQPAAVGAAKAQRPAAGTPKAAQPAAVGAAKAQQPAAGTPKASQTAAGGAAKAQQPAAGTPKAPQPAAVGAAQAQQPAVDTEAAQRAAAIEAARRQQAAIEAQNARAEEARRREAERQQRRAAAMTAAAATAVTLAASVVPVPRCGSGLYRNRDTGQCEPVESRPMPQGEFIVGRCSPKPGAGPDEETVRGRNGSVRLVRDTLTLSSGGRTRTLVDIYDLPSSTAARWIDGEVLFADAYVDVPAQSNTCRGESAAGGILQIIDVPLVNGGSALACIQYCPIDIDPAARMNARRAHSGGGRPIEVPVFAVPGATTPAAGGEPRTP